MVNESSYIPSNLLQVVSMHCMCIVSCSWISISSIYNSYCCRNESKTCSKIALPMNECSYARLHIMQWPITLSMHCHKTFVFSCFLCFTMFLTSVFCSFISVFLFLVDDCIFKETPWLIQPSSVTLSFSFLAIVLALFCLFVNFTTFSINIAIRTSWWVVIDCWVFTSTPGWIWVG